MKREGRRSRAARSAAVAWITELLRLKHWTGTDLAREAGLAPSTVLRLLSDPTHQFIPSRHTLQKISRASGYPIPPDLREAVGAVRFERTGLAPSEEDEHRARRLDSPIPEASGSVPLSTISALPSSLRARGFEPGAVARPPQLEGDSTAFAFHMPDGALEPWIKSGSLLFGSRLRDPLAGDIVLITDANDRSRVRLLTQMNQDALRLRGANGGEEETLEFAEIKNISVVVVIVRR